MAILNVPIQIRTDSEQNWNSSTLILKDGEPALCKKNDGTSELKFGDGQKTYKELPVFGKSWSKEQDNTDLLVILASIENNQADATYEEILSVITNKHNVAVLYNEDIYQLSKKDSNNISFICTKNSGRAILTLSSANTWTDSFENWSAKDISFKIGEDQLASNVQEEIDKLKENSGVQLNDSAINTTEAWSSKKIVDTLCPAFSVSGNPVTCNPVEDYPLSAVVTLEPKQAGSGDPSPENVRPISGYDSVTVTQSTDEAQVKQITLTLPETIYGGTVDAVTGKGNNLYLFKELAIADMNNAEEYPGWFNEPWINDVKHNYKPEGSFVQLGIYGVTNITDISQSAFWNSKGAQIYSTTNNWGGKTQSQIKEAYPDLVVQFCLQLVTPTPFQATGNQALPAVAGLNTVYTDGDSLAVSGRSDPLSTIQTMQAQITALQDQATQGGTA